MRSLHRSVVITAVVAAALAVGATPVSAAAGVTCSGKTEGMCVYRNDQFTPPHAWFSKSSNVSWFGNWTYYGTSQSVNDSISSASNWSYSCTGYVYKDINYGTPVLAFGPRQVLSNFGGTSVGNDAASSLYWTC